MSIFLVVSKLNLKLILTISRWALSLFTDEGITYDFLNAIEVKTVAEPFSTKLGLGYIDVNDCIFMLVTYRDFIGIFLMLVFIEITYWWQLLPNPSISF